MLGQLERVPDRSRPTPLGQVRIHEAADEGHCYLPAPNLMTDAAKILEVPAALITPCLDELAATERVIRESVPPSNGAETAPQVPAAYLPPFHAAERGLASALLCLLAARADRLAAFREVDWDKALASLRSRTGAPLAPEQEEAVRLALTSRVAMLTGGPGCGKSFTVRSVVALARAKGAKVVLAAPTGRAAKPLAELTGTKRPPSTACCSCVQAASPRSMPPHRWTQIWWWTRPRLWT